MAFLGLFLSAFTWAAPAEVTVQPQDQILLRGLNAQVIYNAAPGGATLHIKGLSEAGWTMSKREGVVALDGPEGDSRRVLSAQLKDHGSRPLIEISGPSVPIEIHLREGHITLNKGAQDARVHLKNGRVTSVGRGGPLKISLLKGDVSISDQSGRVDVDVYQGNLTVRNMQGDGELQLFSGQLWLDQSRGNVAINMNSGSGKVQSFSGTLQIDNVKAALSGSKLSGRIEGFSAEGPLNLQIAGESDIHLKTQSARVNLQLPPASGASLNLLTNEGEIIVPKEVGVLRTHLEKTARGRLRGEGGKVTVFVRSQEGSILVK
ncbi:MAG: DUF4097 family beta strand repeat protein [Bdellovibrionaceae bacterium]|nr:DUF4097 family beta strand repeat protein [Pseudobdellovibrionaceae bacterium]